MSEDVSTSIDLSYSVTWKNEAGRVSTSKSLSQKLEVVYTSSLGSLYDFDSKFKVNYDVSKGMGETTRRNLNQTLDLKLQSDNLGMTSTLGGTRSFTDSTIDTSSVVSIGNNFLFEVVGKPFMLPEFKLKLERKREYQEQAVNRYGTKANLDLNYSWEDLNAKLSIAKELNENEVPDNIVSRNTAMEFGLDYGRKFSNLLDLQIEYNVKESLSKERFGGNYLSSSKDAIQKLEIGMKSAIALPWDVFASLTYDFSGEQDLMKVDYNYKVGNSITANVKRSFEQWLALEFKYEGTDDRLHAIGPEEDTDKVKNKLSVSLRWKPLEWMEFESKAEKEISNEIVGKTGGSVDRTEVNRFESNLSLSPGTAIRAQVNQSFEEEHDDGLLKRESTKYKFRLPWQTTRWTKLEPSFENGLINQYSVEHGVSEIDDQKRDWAAAIMLSFQTTLTRYVGFSADHSFRYEFTQDLNAMRELDEDANLSEDSKLSLKIQDIVAGMKMDAELTRKATDTKDDDEPMIVDRSLSVKWEWAISDYLMSATYKFDDKGDADDSLSFEAFLGWKKNFFEVSGEYTYDKTFSEEIDEATKLDVKCKLVF